MFTEVLSHANPAQSLGPTLWFQGAKSPSRESRRSLCLIRVVRAHLAPAAAFPEVCAPWHIAGSAVIRSRLLTRALMNLFYVQVFSETTRTRACARLVQVEIFLHDLGHVLSHNRVNTLPLPSASPSRSRRIRDQRAVNRSSAVTVKCAAASVIAARYVAEGTPDSQGCGATRGAHGTAFDL